MLERILRAVCGLAVAVGAAAALSAHSQAPGTSVIVDFFAVGPDGSVFDLRPEEVTIKIDGRNRLIRSLRYVTLSRPEIPVVESNPDLEPPFATNAIAPATRWVTIVLDHESIRAGAERNAINAAVRYINTLGPRDRISYVTMPNGGMQLDFTTNHQQVITALRRFVASAPSESTEQERSCRSRLLLNTLSDYLRSLTPLQGPKTIVLVSSGILNPRRDAPMNAPPGPCEIRQIYFQEVSTAASMVRAHLYVVQPDDLKMDSPRQAFTDRTASRFAGADEDRAGLESLAGVTGGDFMRIVGPDDHTLMNLAKGLTGYYVATVDVTPGEVNGAMHRVEVDVSRDRVRVRTNPEIHLVRSQTTAPNASATEMIRNGLSYRALPIRAMALPSAGDGGKVKILAVVEGIEPGVKFAEVVFGLIDTRDRLVAQWTANEAELASSPLITAGAGVPGPYRLRVAAIDSNGRRGTTEFEFVARLTEADPLALSALALGVSRDGGFSPKLVFGTDQAAVAYFEIYGSAPRSDSISVRLEIAAGPDERALASAAPRVVAQGSLRHIAVGALPIASLQPGEYTVRAIVSVDGRPVGRVTRTLRKSPLGS
jgi:VWFA-related protein